MSYFGYISKQKGIGFGYGWLGKRRDFRMSFLDSVGRIKILIPLTIMERREYLKSCVYFSLFTALAEVLVG